MREPKRPGLWLARLRDGLIGLLLFAGAFAVYRKAEIYEMGDPRYTLLVSANLLAHGEFALDRYHLDDEQPIDAARPRIYQLERVRGRQYYYFPPGSSVLSVPYLAIMKIFGWSPLGPGDRYDGRVEGVLQLHLASILMAAFVVLAYFTARLLLPRAWSVVVALVAGFGTQVFSTSAHALGSDTWGIVLVGLGVFSLLRAATRQRPPPGIWLGTVLMWSYFTRPTNAVAVAATAVYLALENRRALGAFLATSAVWGAAFVLYSWHHFGTLLPAYFAGSRLSFGVFFTALAGNLVSPSRGLLVTVPASLAVLLLLVRHRRWLRFPRLATAAVVALVGHLVAISGFSHWWGGFSFGARLCTGMVPWLLLLGILGGDAARSHRAGAVQNPSARATAARVGFLALGAFLCAASVAIHTVGAVSVEVLRWNAVPINVDQHPEQVWDWRRPQFLAPFIEPPAPFPPLPRAGLPLPTAGAAPYLGFGWSNPEGECRWTEGSSATLRFAASPAASLVLEIDMRPFSPRNQARQRLDLVLNGRALPELTITELPFLTYRVPLPAPSVARENVLRWRLPDAASPSEVGLPDRRRLGLCVREIRLSEGTTR